MKSDIRQTLCFIFEGVPEVIGLLIAAYKIERTNM